MSLHSSTFEAIVPSRYIKFTIPNPLPTNHNHLGISVLDSPISAATTAAAAAMCVPHGRESDWIFSTFSGHLHLLLSSPTPLSRLILISNSQSSIQLNLTPLLLALTPKSSFGHNGEIPEVPFLCYEDDVAKFSILEVLEGPCVGEMLVENVELEKGGNCKDFRRRLRFKRMPNLVQTQMRIFPKKDSSCEELGNVEFELDHDVLVHPYLSPMVAGISVISSHLEGRIVDGFRPKALCLGVGGGALVGFLSQKMGFKVVGVEEDKVVLEVAEKYFGLESNESIRLCIGDGIEYLIKLAKKIDLDSKKFDVIMVDLDSSDATLGVCAPPLEFIRKSVLLAARDVLSDFGVLIVNTICLRESFYGKLIREFRVVFEELYEIDVGNGENFVLVATKSRIEDSDANNDAFFSKLELFVSRTYIDSIRKISKG